MAKADLHIAHVYSELVKNAALRTRVFVMLEDEFLRSRKMILSISGQRELLARNRVLARSIHLRNPYVDPMSLIQVELLRRKQQGQELAKLEYPLWCDHQRYCCRTAQYGIGLGGVDPMDLPLTTRPSGRL